MFGHLCHGQLDSRNQQFPKILLSPTLQPNQVYCVSVSLAVEVRQLWNRIQYFQIWRDPRYFQNNSVWMSLSRSAGFQKLIISENIIISNVAAKSSILCFRSCLLCLQLLKLDSSGTAFNIFKSGETQDIFKIILFGYICSATASWIPENNNFQKYYYLQRCSQIKYIVFLELSSVSLAVEVRQLWNRIQYFQIWRDQDIFKYFCLDISATASWIPENNNFQKYYYLQRCSQIKYIVFLELSSVSLAVEVGQLWNRIQYFQIWRDQDIFKFLCLDVSVTASWIPENNNFQKYYYLQRCSQIKYIVDTSIIVDTIIQYCVSSC
ncbi:Hypothetical_protein [Hexamita inflata]|uniref:Hypothetical_protein n=1 Tax=Hexamita inflata TaxID=28002 RepID=A0ABP1JU62_9EUKA